MRRCLVVLLLAGLAVVGCGGGPKTYPVRGRVTFDGQPVEDGEIILVPVESELGPEAGRIQDGTFAFRARAGKKRVEIRAAREVPAKRTPMGPCYEDYIPAWYNSQTELELEVVPGGRNQWDFRLTSRKK